MKNAIIVGGSNGIGLAITLSLTDYDQLFILDRSEPGTALPPNCRYIPFDLLEKDYSVLDRLPAISTLIITAGYGKLALFKDMREEEIEPLFLVNTVGVIRIIKHFYDRIQSSSSDFYCSVMVSISGMISSPFFSVYSATKAALHRFIESVNVELEKNASINRILEVSPGAIKGTHFNGRENDLLQTRPLALDIVKRMRQKETLFIPDYETTFKEVIRRYNDNPHDFGLQSYEYKIKSGRINQ